MQICSNGTKFMGCPAEINFSEKFPNPVLDPLTYFTRKIIYHKPLTPNFQTDFRLLSMK
jgi:hypothetical protein